MNELIALHQFPVQDVLSKLLFDKSTGKNIIFATDTYRFLGRGYGEEDQITLEVLRGFGAADIQPRVKKAQAQQSERTRKKAEVFTPTWIVKKMNDECEKDWLSSDANRDWKKIVLLRVLEITCGEAPFLVTRYDTTTGDVIPVSERTGILDRKLKLVNENTKNETEWINWTIKAFESTYGYEYQGDNLLIARINLLVTFCDYLQERFNRKPIKSELSKIANIISWNIWQMDALKDTTPFGMSSDTNYNYSLFAEENKVESTMEIKCRIYDWRRRVSLVFGDIKEGKTKMKFDYVVGNPPYQEDRRGESTTALPVYHDFMQAAYSIATVVELITPARFLFNAGRTPREWNESMLSDPHLKVVEYEKNASNIFPNTEIKGGVAITYRDIRKEYTPIGTFTVHPELNPIISKVKKIAKNDTLDKICFVATKFNTKNLFSDYPKYEGHERRMSSNVLSFDCFSECQLENQFIMIYGVIKGKRNKRYISLNYVDMNDTHIKTYKIIMPKADGNGSFGDTLTMPEILPPNSGFTHTFLGMGAFDNETEASSALKYIKTKFSRALLSALKVTQDMNADKWKLVPLQDFTENSDIDWSVSIPEIDKQLYKKYDLSEEEIEFIEAHVKEMV